LKQTPNKDDKTGEEVQDRPLFSSPEFDKFRATLGQADAQLGSMIAQAQQFTDLKIFQLPYQYGKIEAGFRKYIFDSPMGHSKKNFLKAHPSKCSKKQ